jgi:hypothetical protein
MYVRINMEIICNPVFLHSVRVRSGNFVKTCTMSCIRVLSSAALQLIYSRPLVAFGNKESEC